MEIVLTKRKILTGLLIVLAAVVIATIALRLSGKTAAQAVGYDSGRGAALAGAQVFYSVDYHDGQDVWAARLCSVSTQPACDFYQNTVAPFLWQGFETAQTVVTARAGNATLLAEETAATRQDAPMQIWRVWLELSAPLPQGNGQTSFPAHVLVVREEAGWKFERFLLEDELVKYAGDEE